MNRWRQRCALVLGLFFSVAAVRGQYAFTDQNSVSSVSGQFFVSSLSSDAPGFRGLNPAANTNVIRLKTALLAVAADRFKLSLWQQLGLPSTATWSGKVFLRLHPARSFDETVVITSSPFLDHWNYGVELPDLILKTHYARALSGVLLLEIANRSASQGGRSAEMPAWLVDGMAQHVLAADGTKAIMSAPVKKDDSPPVDRIDQTKDNFDPLASARQILLTLPPLTFAELSWPTEVQMAGADGGAYLASAQLFQAGLVELNNGRGKMRALLAELPRHLNWQTAFFLAFRDDFKSPLDVEKWWALRVVTFCRHAPGPRWTADVSLIRLQGLLSVPVDYRNDSNALPVHAEISLQAALKSLQPEQQGEVLRVKERDLALAELRLSPPFLALADGYRQAIADFLGEFKSTAPPLISPHAPPKIRRNNLPDTLVRLDELDARRRTAESQSVIHLR